MKTAFSLCLALLLCTSGFSEETATPHAGTFGVTAVIQTPSDSDGWVPGNGLNVNPGVGAGLQYHPFNFLMLELRLFLSYDYLLVAGGTSQYAQLTSEAGVFYWANLDSSLSILLGPRFVFSHVYGFGNQDIDRVLVAGVFGVQYSFSKHFAVYSDFGLGLLRIQTNPGSIGDNYIYIKVFSPEVGVAFYF
jgi:hypothetical protein